MIFIKRHANYGLLGIFLLLLSCAEKDAFTATPDQVFVKYYGVSGAQELTDIAYNPDTDGDKVVLYGTQTRAELGADADLYLVEVDTNGNETRSVVYSLDDLIYPDSAEYNTQDLSRSIKRLENGYLISGSYGELVDAQIVNIYMFWMFLDNELAIQNWDTIQTSGSLLINSDIIQTSDGNVVLLGETFDQAANDLTPNAGLQYFLVKRDFNADTTIFRKTYGYSNSNEIGAALFEMDNLDLAILGTTDRLGSAGGAGGTNVSIMILNPLATSQKVAKEYGLTVNNNNQSDDVVNRAISTSSGFVVAGTSTVGNIERAFTMGISRSGNLIFRTSVESQWGINTRGNAVSQTRENDLFLVGSYPIFSIEDETVDINKRNKNSEVMAMRVDPFGIPRTGLESNFGVVSGDDEATAVILLPSGSLLVGATVDFGSGQTMMALKKMNDLTILQKP